MASVNGSSRPASSPAIETIPAQSPFIAAFEYDAQNLTLTTHLKNGAIYQYKFVVPGDWAALQTSQNQSKHWSDNIRAKKQSVRVKAQKSPNSEIKTGRK
jgi:hypothetical protein